jgi:hypothetical protein
MNAAQFDALVNIENKGPEWLDWCAALYESYATDHEIRTVNLTEDDPWVRSSFRRYSDTAHALAEQLELNVYDSQERALYAKDYGSQDVYNV